MTLIFRKAVFFLTCTSKMQVVLIPVAAAVIFSVGFSAIGFSFAAVLQSEERDNPLGLDMRLCEKNYNVLLGTPAHDGDGDEFLTSTDDGRIQVTGSPDLWSINSFEDGSVTLTMGGMYLSDDDGPSPVTSVAPQHWLVDQHPQGITLQSRNGITVPRFVVANNFTNGVPPAPPSSAPLDPSAAPPPPYNFEIVPVLSDTLDISTHSNPYWKTTPGINMCPFDTGDPIHNIETYADIYYAIAALSMVSGTFASGPILLDVSLQSVRIGLACSIIATLCYITALVLGVIVTFSANTLETPVGLSLYTLAWFAMIPGVLTNACLAAFCVLALNPPKQCNHTVCPELPDRKNIEHKNPHPDAIQ